MPGEQPASTYPFASNILLFIMQIIITIYGYKSSFTMRMVTSFLGLAGFMIAVPYFANEGGGFAYDSVFILCLFYGFFAGICLCTVFQMGA